MRVLVATALALLAMMMMSRSCVADPVPDQAPEATIDPPFPEPENKIPVELEDNGDFDLSNMAQGQDESVDQLTNVDAEVADSSTFYPTDFQTSCQASKSRSNCTSFVKFYAMGRTYTMTVSIITIYYSTSNRLLFYVYVNRSHTGCHWLSAAEDAVQTFQTRYYSSPAYFDFVLTASNMYTMTHSGTRSCWSVQIKSSNKVWANVKQKCRVFH